MSTGLEKSKFVINSLAVIGIPLVIAWVGNSYTNAIKEREIQAKFVEIAIEILDNPVDSTNSKKNLREWSVEVINKYSGVPLNEGATKDLIERSSLIGTKDEFISNCQFKAPLIFSFDRTDIRPETQIALSNIITYLEIHPDLIIRIEAHTYGPGSDDYHMALSERRARSIKDYMISRGIPSDQIANTTGYGATRPCKTLEEINAITSPEEKEMAIAMNNRVRIIIVGCEDETTDCAKY